jgi:D-sedoheptulose 7-phosphate isomerase
LDINKFTEKYTLELNESLQKLDKNELQKFINLLIKSAKNNSKVYIIGNGGSASTASHMANDLSIGLKRRNIINIDAISLSDNSSVITAISNDIGYDNIFYMQLKDTLKVNDIVVAISCSGNSANIIKAIQYAKKCGNTIVGLSGFDGGELYKLSDIKLHIQTQKGKYGLVEDAHSIINHMISEYIQINYKIQ